MKAVSVCTSSIKLQTVTKKVGRQALEAPVVLCLILTGERGTKQGLSNEIFAGDGELQLFRQSIAYMQYSIYTRSIDRETFSWHGSAHNSRPCWIFCVSYCIALLHCFFSIYFYLYIVSHIFSLSHLRLNAKKPP